MLTCGVATGVATGVPIGVATGVALGVTAGVAGVEHYMQMNRNNKLPGNFLRSQSTIY